MQVSHVDIDDIEKECIQEKQNEPFINTFAKRLLYTLAKDKYAATERDYFLSASYAVKDHLVSRWTKTQQEYYHQDAKRIYYLSMEFLTGRALGNSLINLGMYDDCVEGLEEAGLDLEELREFVDRLKSKRIVLVHLCEDVVEALKSGPIPRVVAGFDGMRLEL